MDVFEAGTDEVKSRAAVEGGENIRGSAIAGREGSEEYRRSQIGKSEHLLGGDCASVSVGGGLSAGKPIGEVMSTEAILPTQLTIFYGGNVSVFEGIPTEKIHEILRVAAALAFKSTETKNSISNNLAPLPALNRAPSFSSTSTAASPGAQSYPIHPNSLCRSAADLPIARRYSLQRFLEKRRDRLVSKSPYLAAPDTKKVDLISNNPSKAEENPIA